MRPFLVGLGATAVAASTVGLVTSRVNARQYEQRRAEQQRPDPVPGNSVADNVDGIARIAMLGTTAFALPVAAAAAIFRRPSIATGALGVSLGLTGAALLAGGEGGPLSRARMNLGTTGSAISAPIHASLSSSNPRVENHLPHVAPKVEARPDASAIRAADLLPEGTVDHEGARKAADDALARIDFSRRDIVLWMPSTYAHEMSHDWQRGIEQAFGDRATSTHIDYPAEINFGSSVATGVEALRLVLAGIAERGGEHRVLLGGHSQGAWVVADTMATPELHAMVDRAILFGNPGPARHHFDHEQDGKVVEINDLGDAITYPIHDREGMLSGTQRITDGEHVVGGLEMAKVALHNPRQATYIASRTLDPQRWDGQRDPHHYEELFGDAARWLDQGGIDPTRS